MKRRSVARAAAVAAWGTGMTLILAGVPVLAVLVTLTVIAAATVACAWRDGVLLAALTTWVKAWAKARVTRIRRTKTGRTVERA